MEKTWVASIYVRISKDDGDTDEGDSIINQKALLRDFLKTKPDINLVSERIDDGFTGVNFERPSFKMMMEDVKSGRINCILVKDARVKQKLKII